jgi:hypothetical protein
MTSKTDKTADRAEALKSSARALAARVKAARKRPSSKVAHRAPIEDKKDYVVLGHGKFQDGFQPYWAHMDQPSRIEMRTKREAIDELKWHRERNPEFDVRVFRLEPVAFSHE